MRRLISCLPLLVTGALSAEAQVIVGDVVEAGTLQPLSAAFVLLEDEAGRRGNGVLTGPDGRYALRASSPGRFPLSDAVSIEVIEVFRHPTDVPALYGGSDSMCGVVLIWTRQG